MSVNSTIALPTVMLAKKRLRWWVGPALALTVLAGALAVRFRPWAKSGDAIITGQFYTVVPVDLEVKIAKDGELQAVRYTDIECRVEGSNQIVWLVKEGVTVQQGDELVKLDSSNLQIRKEQVDLDVKRAESNLRIAQEMKEILASQCAASKEAAEVFLELAKLELKRYLDGVYPQLLEDAKTAFKMANITLTNRQEDLDQTKALFNKGFVTGADVKKGELDVTSATNLVRSAQTSLTVLEQYTKPMEMTRLKTGVAQAEQKLMRVIRENAGLMAQKEADLDEKESSVALYKRQQAKLQKQLDNCIMRAPENGLVIYMSSIDRSMREPIKEGIQVWNTQALLRLPDVSSMKAVMKIQEAQKPKLDISRNQRAFVKILGVNKPIGATLSKVAVLPDNSQRWWNPDLKEYPVELTLDETPAGLKPGTRVDVELLIDRLDQVVAVPLSSIYTVGSDSYVFIKSEQTVKERKVTIGITNETHVQVTSGLAEGEQVLMLQAGQGRAILEKAGIKIDEPTSRPARGSRWGGKAKA